MTGHQSKMRHKRNWKLFAILFSLLTILSGTSLAQDEMTLRVGMLAPFSLDPALASNDPEVLINRHLYDYLIDVEPNGELVPSLAQNWEVSPDGRVYTLQLVNNATFHDGSRLTSADVVHTFNRLITLGASPVDIMGMEIVGTDEDGNSIEEPTWDINALSDLIIEFTLDRPNVDFLYGLSSRFALIIPDGQDMPNLIDDDGNLTNVNGTGAYRLDSFDAEDGAVLIANEDYWRGKPELERIEFTFIDEKSEQIAALRNDEVDFVFKIPNSSLPVLQFNPDITPISVDTNTHPTIRLRSDTGHLGEDIRIRQAFKYATDRELLNVLALNGLGIVANNDPIGPIYAELYQPVDDLPYDPDLACDLLADYANEFPDNPWISIDDDDARLEIEFFVVQAFEYPQMAEYLAEQWEDACIYVDIQVRPENIYYGNGEWQAVELGVTGWGTRPTAQEYLNVAYVTGAPLNETGWSNTELDSLVEQSASATTVTERRAIYNQIRAIFAEEGPIIIPFFTPIHGAYRNTVNGIEMHPFPGRTNFYNVTVG